VEREVITMSQRSRFCVVLGALSLAASLAADEGPRGLWPIHDRTRPQPRVVDPGTSSTQEEAGRPPSDAVVLFDGKDLSGWRTVGGGPAKWTVGRGYFEVAKGTGSIETVEAFGDCQLHVEWRTPSPGVGEDQDRGNSGVYLMGLYEVQVLDSYRSRTYPDGQAAALYGQSPPLVNASRPPGEWQTYDIVFHRPRFDKEGKLLRPARASVLHNGVLVQDETVLTGPTAHEARPPYKAHASKLPLMLQDHNHPVRFRNVWIRELDEGAKLVWSDEFEGAAGASPDPERWSFDVGGGGWGNQELESYTSRPQNARLDGSGNLVIEAIREPFTGEDGTAREFTSARLKTQWLFAQAYGRFEARMKLPEGQGIWPAFWLLGVDIGDVGWPACGEIDIMENIGREPTMVHGTLHGPGYSGAAGIGAAHSLAVGRFADAFHVFAVEWDPAAIRWYVDDVLYATRTPSDVPKGARWAFDHPFFIILNLAVGGNWPGNPDATTTFPQRLLVDYVRVYAR
jgi:beta-glucanase (GH16 family)